MKQTGDLNLVKRMNKSLVLDAIIAHAPVSRADIAANLGLNKATVSSLVAEWIDERLVVETGLGASSGGRKPVMLHFRRGAGYAVGIDLGVGSVSAVLTDLSGAVIARRQMRLRAKSPLDAARAAASAARALAAEAPSAAEAPYGVVGVGIGVPGIVDDAGVVAKAPNFGWRNVPFKALMEQELAGMPNAASGLRVVLENEANAGAVGEKMYGIGRSIRDMVYISAGMGLGAGLILGGELFRGASGFSGEIGHMAVAADGGRTCSCGSVGCWELYASELALAAAGSGRPELRELESALRLAESGDAAAAELLSAIGRYLGIGVANAVNIFNPELVVIGGRLSLARDWLGKPLLKAAARRTLHEHMGNTRIEFAALGQNSTALGAASLAIARFLGEKKTGAAAAP